MLLYSFIELIEAAFDKFSAAVVLRCVQELAARCWSCGTRICIWIDCRWHCINCEEPACYHHHEALSSRSPSSHLWLVNPLLLRFVTSQMPHMRQYQVVGRKAPTEADPNPPAYRMKVFSATKVGAISSFWYLIHQMRKMKKTTVQEVTVSASLRMSLDRVYCKEHNSASLREKPFERGLRLKVITEKNSRIIKHYGIWLRYDSRSGTHNMYREYRDLTLTGSVDQMYSEMAGRHRCRPRSIQIIRTGIVAAKDTKRAPVKQFQHQQQQQYSNSADRLSALQQLA
eukprot:17942-Heterococcus_DN1.PRE.3